MLSCLGFISKSKIEKLFAKQKRGCILQALQIQGWRNFMPHKISFFWPTNFDNTRNLTLSTLLFISKVLLYFQQQLLPLYQKKARYQILRMKLVPNGLNSMMIIYNYTVILFYTKVTFCLFLDPLPPSVIKVGIG